MKQRKFTTLTVKRGGKTFKKSVAFRSLQELMEKKAAFEKECEQSEKNLFKDVADQWQEEHFKTIQYYTAQSYIAPLKDLLADFGEMDVAEIFPLDIQRFLEKMSNQGYARQTINLRKVVLSMILDYAVLQGYINFNPAKVCKVPKSQKSQRTPPTPEEIRKIHAAPDSFWKRYYLFLMYTGLRREEALAIQKDDIDIENCTVRVNKVIVFQNATPTVRNFTKSEAGNRLAPFPTILHYIFKDAKKGYIFAHNGKPLSKGQFDRGIEKFKRETGITCSSHQLRHFFATMCHEVIDAKDAQHLLGHAKVSTTLDIYTNLDIKQKKQAIEKLNQYIAQNT